LSRTFDHRHAGHCETGALSALLRDRGLDLSEPMVFGLGGGVFFVHIPFIKMGGIPLTAYRDAPGAIIKTACKRLHIPVRTMRFGNEAEGVEKLDSFLGKGMSVGLRTNVYWLPYFPKEMRFQFNAHHLVVFGKEGDDYLISDPVFDHTVRCAADDLKRARFAKGLFAPKGHLFFPDALPAALDLKKAVRESIRKTSKRMTSVPFPFIGVRGIRYLSRELRKLPVKMDAAKAVLTVGSVVRMQEEIGTGGAGFRFMYAAFLQEASEVMGAPALKEASQMMGETGDRWRGFAVKGAQLCKGYVSGNDVFNELSEMLNDCADREQRVYKLLLKITG
jgi:hypothetical protein